MKNVKVQNKLGVGRFRDLFVARERIKALEKENRELSAELKSARHMGASLSLRSRNR